MINTEYPGFIKDDTPGQARAVLNIDNASFESFKQVRNRERALKDVSKDVDQLKQDMADIKSLLMQLVNGNK